MQTSINDFHLRGFGPLGIAALLAGLTAPAFAQGSTERFLVSTTNDVGALDAALPVLTDTDLMAVGAGARPAPWFTVGHWFALADFAPRDVDGAALRGSVAAAGDLYMSFLSDDGGFLDGDLVRLDADGVFRVAVAEDQIALALGDAALDIDVDAFAFDGAVPGAPGLFGGGRLVFSLAADVDTAVLGPVQNGDVLALDESGVLTRLFAEDDVSDALALATGSSASIGDVHGLEVVSGEVWVAVQSPSEFDGAVLALGALARIVADEADLALGGEELDALIHLGPEQPLSLWLEGAVGGSNGRGVVQNGTPGGPALLVGAGAAGWFPTPELSGFGGLAVDMNDPLLTALLAGPSLPIYWLDSEGSLALPANVSSVGAGTGPGGGLGLTLQAVDLLSGRVSAPFRIVL
ncbi:hypothetical protein Pla163_22460 [Planctomycetes bacterium Pla163]|uniref:Uncharacterized protein n=1 Tax=Rohdeia mirabilis TaxID=2528008 RepID=A0A518D0Y9_9BACT|nr:hypothetical protein Pla163_22460 [Planctomycetes bacterium Pla163]